MAIVGQVEAQRSLGAGWPEIANVCIAIEQVGDGLSTNTVFCVRSHVGDFRLDAIDVEWPQAKLRVAERLLFACERSSFPLVAIRVPPSHASLMSPQVASHVWQLHTWLPGATVSGSQWTAAHTRQAFSALAALHQTQPASRRALSAALTFRRRRLLERREQLSSRCWSDWLGTTRPLPASRVAVTFPGSGDLLAAIDVGLREVASVVGQPVPVQPCWGDAWHGNVLFDDGQVSGLIDFAAAVVDSPMIDLARMIGSLPGGTLAHSAALSAYNCVGGLTELDDKLIRAFDASGIVLSLANWLDWLQAAAPATQRPQAAERISHLIERIGTLRNYLDSE